MSIKYSDIKNSEIFSNVSNNQLVMNNSGSISGYTPISEITQIGTTGLTEGQTLKIQNGIVSSYEPSLNQSIDYGLLHFMNN